MAFRHLHQSALENGDATDLFALSFVYRGGQVIMPHYTNVLTKATHFDLYVFLKSAFIKRQKYINPAWSKQGIFKGRDSKV